MEKVAREGEPREEAKTRQEQPFLAPSCLGRFISHGGESKPSAVGGSRRRRRSEEWPPELRFCQ